MANRLSEQQIIKYQQAFQLIDKNSNGIIQIKQLGTLMRSLGQNPAEAELQDMINEIDADKDVTINFSDFLSLMVRKIEDYITEEELIEICKIDKIRHIQFSLSQGGKLSDEEFNEMMREAEIDEDNNINYQQFVRIMMSKQ